MARNKTLTQDILLRVRAPALPANNGLKQSLDLMRQMEVLLRGINQHIGSVGARMGAFNARSITELLKVKGAKTLAPHDLGMILGVTPNVVDAWMANLQHKFKSQWASMFTGGQFRSLPQAGKFFEAAFKKDAQFIQKTWAGMMGGAQPRLSAIQAAAKISGSQVSATLVTPPLITLQVPASAIHAQLVGGSIPLQAGTGPAGSTTPAGTGASIAKSKGGTPVPPGTGGETRRVIRKNKDGDIDRVTVDQALAPFHTLATTYAGQDETSVETIRRGAALRQQMNAAMRAELAQLKTARRVHRKNPFAMAAAYQQSAAQLEHYGASLGPALQAAGLGHMVGDVAQRAALLRTEAGSLYDPTRGAFDEESRRVAMKRFMGPVAQRALRSRAALDKAETRRREGVHAEQQAHYDSLQADVDRQAMLRNTLAEARQQGVADWHKEQDRRDRVRARQQRVLDRARKEATPPKLDVGLPGGGAADIPAWRKKWFGPTGVASLGNLGGQMFSNIASVTAWGIPAFAMTSAMGGAIGGARFAGASAMDTSLQTARLSQVFRGVGGDAKQLTGDILGLAAAEGRSRKEAMESAIQWSRLGLTRQQVGEATRVSLLAANVAELDALDATEKLQAVQKAYGLQVRELAGVLGVLNSISNTYNVTNAAMMEGLTRTASVAKQAGVPLAELIGLLGATVGATGQSGANVGNAIKSILVSLSNPEIQEFLGERYGLSAKAGGQMKSGSQRLGELWQVYRGLDPAERQNILFRVAGKTQASRMAAMMDSYVTGQVLGIKAQRDLGSAERENVKITAELQYKWTGLVTQTEKLINAFNLAVGGTERLAGALGGLSGWVGVAEHYVTPALKFIKAPVLADVLTLGNAFLPRDVQRKHALDRELEQARAGVTSSRQAQRLFGDMASAVSITGSEVDWLSELMGPALGQELREAHAKGDRGGLRQVLARAAAVEAGYEKHSRGQEMALVARELRLLDADIGRTRTGHDTKRTAELEARKRELTGRGLAFAEELLEGEGMDGMTQERANAKATLRYRLQGVSDRTPFMTASGQLMSELTMLRRQERTLLSEEGRIPAHDMDRQNDVRGLLRDVRSQIAARVNGGSGIAAEHDRQGIARELVKTELDMASVGRDQVEQLTNRARKYAEMVELNRQMLQAATGQQDLDKATAMSTALRVEREQLIMDRVRARAQAAREEYEANRKLLSLGPQALLTRLVGQRLAGSQLGAGAMMAFAPDVRESVMEEGDRTRRNRFLGERQDFDTIFSQLTSENAKLTRLLAAADASANSLGTMNGQALAAAESLKIFREEVQALAGRPASRPEASGPPSVAQAPPSPTFERVEDRPRTSWDWLLGNGVDRQ